MEEKRTKHYWIVLIIFTAIICVCALGIFNIASSHILSASSNVAPIELQDWYTDIPTSIATVEKIEEKVLENNDEEFEEPDETVSPDQPTVPDQPQPKPDPPKPDPPPPSDERQLVWNILTASLSDEVAAGIMGNMERESHFNPKANNNNTYFGLCQWGAGRFNNCKAYCTQNGLDCWSLEGQAKFTVYEFSDPGSHVMKNTVNGYTSDYGYGFYTTHVDLMAGKDVSRIAQTVYATYERGPNKGDYVVKGVNWANDIYNTYHK